MTDINFNEQFVGDLNADKHSGVFNVARRVKGAISVFCKMSSEDGDIRMES